MGGGEISRVCRGVPGKTPSLVYLQCSSSPGRKRTSLMLISTSFQLQRDTKRAWAFNQVLKSPPEWGEFWKRAPSVASIQRARSQNFIWEDEVIRDWTKTSWNKWHQRHAWIQATGKRTEKEKEAISEEVHKHREQALDELLEVEDEIKANREILSRLKDSIQEKREESAQLSLEGEKRSLSSLTYKIG